MNERLKFIARLQDGEKLAWRGATSYHAHSATQFPCFEVGFAPPSKPVTIGSGKSQTVPDPVRWKGNGVRSNRRLVEKVFHLARITNGCLC